MTYWSKEKILEHLEVENVGFQFHELDGEPALMVVIPIDDRSDPEEAVLLNEDQKAWLISRAELSRAHMKRRMKKGRNL